MAVEVGGHWANNFHSPCTQETLSYCDDNAEGFVSGMESRGAQRNFCWGDGNAWETDFRDPAFGGHDNNTDGGVDTVDFEYFSSHGGTSSANVFYGCMSTQHTKCSWQSNEARFGNLDLEYLVLDTCESLDLDHDLIATWHNAFHGLHMIFGFTGSASDAWWTEDRGYDFGRRAGNNAKLADAWLDEAYSSWCDDYPVAMACGRNEDDAIDRLNNERIWSFGDIPHNEIGWYQWKWRS
jgi:hypothetical protein